MFGQSEFAVKKFEQKGPQKPQIKPTGFYFSLLRHSVAFWTTTKSRAWVTTRRHWWEMVDSPIEQDLTVNCIIAGGTVSTSTTPKAPQRELAGATRSINAVDVCSNLILRDGKERCPLFRFSCEVCSPCVWAGSDFKTFHALDSPSRSLSLSLNHVPIVAI